MTSSVITHYRAAVRGSIVGACPLPHLTTPCPEVRERHRCFHEPEHG